MAEIMIQADEGVESVNYRVIENPVASKMAGKPVYTGVVDVKETYNTAAVARRMVEAGCAVKASTIQLVLGDFAELIGKLAAEGRAININGLVRFAPAVRGTFATMEAPWDATKNALVVNASVGTRLRSAAAKSSANRTTRVLLPTLTRVVDLATVSENKITSSGGFFVLGTRLTWDDTQADEGFFLFANGDKMKCRMVESVQDPTCAALITDMTFDPGTPLRLSFRTRIDGILYAVDWAGELIGA